MKEMEDNLDSFKADEIVTFEIEGEKTEVLDNKIVKLDIF